MSNQLTQFLALVSFAGVIALFAMVADMNTSDQEQQERLYCAMVAEGTWPDYNENYERVCK